MAKDIEGSSPTKGDQGFQEILRIDSKPHLRQVETIKPLCVQDFLNDSKKDMEIWKLCTERLKVISRQ